ncbi:hypothetical protein AB833_26095 [Chromatiales bacterium (ex Bugula neritina AB1)]|nr:hypothetical protein AB833_26095 [Chromatiales bacterium (ex Bugula neritina AB1)]
MPEQEQQLDGTPRFEPQGNIVKAKDVSHWKDGAEYLQAAKSEAKSIIADARKQAAKVHQEAYDNATKLAERERLEQDITVSALVNEQIRALEPDFLDLVIATTRKIIDTLPEQEQVASIASKAFERFREERQITIKIHPEMAEYTRVSLNKKMINSHHDASSITIVADNTLAKTDCIIQTQRGVTRAGLDAQLEVIQRNFAYSNEG